MLRIFAIVGLAFVGLGAALAVPISSGTLVPINLTTSNVYIGTCTGFNCTPTVSNLPNTPSAGLGNVSGSYENILFNAAAIDPAAPPPTPSTSPVNVTTGSGTTPFILAAQSASPNNDTYYSTNGSNLDTSLVVDLGTCNGSVPGALTTSTCGLFNVDAVYTMIQANLESFGLQGVTVTLNGVTPLGAAVTDVIKLTAGTDYRGNSSTAAVTCDDANRTSPTSCAAQNSDTAYSVGYDPTPGGTGGNSVTTYNNVFGAQTSGGTNYYFDVQELELGSNFAGDFLNSMTITNTTASGGKERILFSGLSVDEAPEPGTVALLGIGLGLIAFWKIRSQRANG
jgi:hypothetical protein